VSTTPVAILPSVSTTPVANFAAGTLVLLTQVSTTAVTRVRPVSLIYFFRFKTKKILFFSLSFVLSEEKPTKKEKNRRG
jgi:hypothetical protein